MKKRVIIYRSMIMAIFICAMECTIDGCSKCHGASNKIIFLAQATVITYIIATLLHILEEKIVEKMRIRKN